VARRGRNEQDDRTTNEPRIAYDTSAANRHTDGCDSFFWVEPGTANRKPCMPMIAHAQSTSRRMSRRTGNGIMLAFTLGSSIAVLAITLILVLRWPASVAPDAPSLPISVGGIVFNVPPAAIRVALQRHAGQQGRLDLVFLWPALVPPNPAAKPPASEDVPAIDRLFVTITAPDDGLGPAERIRTIYPRYFDFGRFAGPDGLLVIRFRDGTPYQAEDLFYDPAAPDRFVVRCSRPGSGPTPGICLFERRLADAADIVVRFPREWLADWRQVSAGIEKLIASLRPSSS
jgi:hypothetical protein